MASGKPAGASGQSGDGVVDFEVAGGGQQNFGGQGPATDGVVFGNNDPAPPAAEAQAAEAPAAEAPAAEAPAAAAPPTEPPRAEIPVEAPPPPPANVGPVATADVASVNEDQSVVINIKGNDTDADGGTITVTGVSQPAHGTLVLNADGTVTYKPDADYNGTDSFTYTISDGQGGTSTAVVNLTVDSVNDTPVAVDNAFTVNEDNALTLAPSALLAGDSDLDGDTLSLVSVGDATHGTVSIVDGQVVFTPEANYDGAASFTYTISDGQGGTSTATVNLTIDTANDAPVAVADVFTLNEDNALTLAPASLLGNDTDLDGDTLSLVSVGDASHGTVSIVDGQVVFTPAANYNGPASFTYTISDGAGGTSTGVVNLTIDSVNDAPVAVADAYSLNEDNALTLAPASLLGNDTDLDGDTLSLVSVGDASHGTVSIVDGQVVFTPAANYNGPASFTYTISDGAGGTSTGVVNLTVDSVNDAPVAVADAYSLNEDNALTLAPASLLGNDTDLDGDTLSLVSVGEASHGTVSIVDGQVVFTPAANYNGPASFTYTISDGAGGTSTGVVNLTVDSVNDAPVAVNDIATLAEDSSVVINVLGNDTDVDGDVLSVVGVNQPAHGSVTLNDDGTVTYTPAANYNGADSFTYVVTDASGATSTATVSLRVDPQNDTPVAVNDVRTLDEDASLQINVLSNDTDVDGNVLSVLSVGQPAHGTVTINEDGTVTYTPVANYNGADSFTYVASDGAGGTTIATVSLTVNPQNDAPVAVGDVFSLNEDLGLTLNPAQLLGNDTDIDGNALSVLSVQGATHGSVAIVDGQVVFTPAADYNGPASFTYTISDGAGGTSTGTVTLTVNPVNDTPVAVADAFTFNEDNALTLSPASLLGNDTDIDGNALSIQSVQSASHGSVAIVDGQVVFTPAANYNGPASFTYTVSDGAGGTSIATVSLTVNSVNDAPVAVNDVRTLNEDSSLVIDVKANDTDVDGDALTIQSVEQPAHGRVSINADGTVSYTPVANYNGTDSFTYVVRDSSGATSTATVQLTVDPVNDTPVAVNDVFTINEDFTLTVNPTTLLGNDTDIDGNALSITAVSGASHGTVAIVDTAEGPRVRFTPEANYNGPASFTYTISDGAGGTSTAVVNLTVSPVNDTPVAVADTYTLNEDNVTSIPAATLLGNDTDIDGNVLSITAVSGATHGTVTLVDGSPVFTPAANYNGPAQFTYTISDGAGGTSTAVVNLTVSPVNDTPVAVADTYTLNEDNVTSIPAATLLGNDSDVDGNALSITAVSGATHGTVTLVDGSPVFTPAANYNGPAQFTYTISDGAGGTSTAVVNLTVSPVNDTPVAVANSYTLNEDNALSISPASLLANDTDADGNALSITSVQGASHGTVAIVDGQVRFTPEANYNGTASFTYTISDGAGGTSTATVNLTVSAVNDTPVAVNDIATTDEDHAITFNPLANDSDIDGNALTITSATLPAGTDATVSINPNGTLSFTPGSSYNAMAVGQTQTVAVNYTVSDGAGGTSTATATVTITGSNDGPIAVSDTNTVGDDLGDHVTGNVINGLGQTGGADSDPDTGTTLTLTSVNNGGQTYNFATQGQTDAGGRFVAVQGDAGDLKIYDNGSYTYTKDENAGEFAPSWANGTPTWDGVTEMQGTTGNQVVQDNMTVPAGGNSVTVTFQGEGAGYQNIMGWYKIDANGNPTQPKLIWDNASQQGSGGNLIAGQSQVTLDGLAPGEKFGFFIIRDGHSQFPNLDTADSLSFNANGDLVGGGYTVGESELFHALDPNFSDDNLNLDDRAHARSGVNPETGELMVGFEDLTGGGDNDFNDVMFSISYNGTPAVTQDVFTYTLADENGATAAAALTITVDPDSATPIAVADIGTINEDGALTLNVLANDTDADIGDVLSVQSISQPAHGTVVLNANGTVTYTPAANYNGSDSFTYVMNDGTGGTSTAVVNLTVTATNDAPVAVADRFTLNEDNATTITASTLLANDSDVDGNTLSITAVSGATNGTVTLVNGNPVFTPAANYNGTAQFTYTISDGAGGTSSAVVTLTVNPVNDNPVAVANAVTLNEDAATTIQASTLLANDTDVDGNTLSITAVSGATNGTVTLVNGNPVFTPAANYNGTAQFTYTISDGAGGTSSAVVTLTVNPVNDNPVAVANAVTLNEDAATTITASTLLANDSDVDGNTLSITAVSGATNGTVTLVNGNPVFTPAANYNGTAQFTYTISDGAGGTSSAVVTLTVNPVNDNPVAVANAVTLNEDAATTITASTLLANDTDVDGNTLSITAVSGATNGTVTLVNGNPVFTPAANYNGTASFTYTVSDGAGGTSTAVVNLTVSPVNDTPVAVADSFTLNEDNALTIAPSSLVSNDSDIDAGQTLSIASVQGATNGTVAIVNGNVVFTPAANYSGAAAFTYTISDGNGGTATATVNLTIAAQGDVAVSAANVSGNEDTTINLGLSSSSIVISDTDGSESANAIKLTFSNLPSGAVVNGATWSAASNAYMVTSAAALSNVTVIPPANWNGQFGATLTVTTNEGGSSSQNFTVTTNAVNDAPIVTSAPAFTVNEDATITLTKAQLLAGASDVDGNTLSVQNLVVNGGQGTLSGPNANGDYTYTPPANFSGSVGLTYKVSDGTATVNQTAAIGVTAVADAPTVTAALGTPVAVVTNAVTATQAIDVSNVTSGNNGFTVTAQKINSDGTISAESSSNLSISTSGSPTGFGVSGAASGDSTELGRSSAGVSEQLNVQLAGDVTSAKVTFAWLSTSEQATYKLYDNGVLVGTGTVTGQTDNIDPEITITATNGVAFDKIVFSAPGADDDFLINNISFTKVITPGSTVAQYPLNISTALADADGSESLSTIRVTGVPSTATLSAGIKNADGSYTLTPAQLSGLKINVTNGQTTDFNLSVSATSTESSNADAKTTTVSLAIPAPDFTASAPTLTTAAISGSEDTAIALNIGAVLGDADGSETLSVTISGVPTGATLSAGTLNSNGTWTLTQGQLSGLKITPANDSSTDFTLTVTATSTESLGGATSTTTATIPVTVAGVADLPTLDVSSSLMTTSYAATAVNFPSTITSAIQSGYTVTVSGVPTGATLSAGTNNGDGTWTVPGASAATLTITPPANYSGSVSLTATVINPNGGTSTPISATFNSGLDGFSYADGSFGGSTSTSKAYGEWDNNDGVGSTGALELELGGGTSSSAMSGGFSKSFTTTGSSTGSLTFSYRVDADEIEANDGEYARVMVSIDGVNKGTNGYVAQVVGTDSGWVTVTVDLGTLAAGSHTFTIGGLLNSADHSNDEVEMNFDNLSLNVTGSPANVATQSVSVVPTVASLTYDLNIAASLNDLTGESLTVQLSSIPSGVTLSHGTLSGGVWTVNSADLPNLTMTVPTSTAAFDLSVSAKSTDSDGNDISVITKTIDYSDFKGLATNDTLTGTAGNDTQYGGAGDDTISGNAGDDVIWAGSGNDLVYGGDGADTIRGGAGTDTLYGGNNNDTIYGGQGNDIIYGDAGNDIVIGGEGNDTLYGGAGADTFVFNLGDGTDTVMGFENGDQLNFNGISLNGGDTLGITAQGNDVVITIIGQDGAQGSSVTLKDAAAGMDASQREHISDGYSVTDTGQGVTVVIDQNS